MNVPETDLGREVRMEVAAILAKYNGPHEAIAGVKVSTLRKIDALINPEPESFEPPAERADEGKFASRKFATYAKAHAYEHMIFEETGQLTMAAIVERSGRL